MADAAGNYLAELVSVTGAYYDANGDAIPSLDENTFRFYAPFPSVYDTSTPGTVVSFSTDAMNAYVSSNNATNVSSYSNPLFPPGVFFKGPPGIISTDLVGPSVTVFTGEVGGSQEFLGSVRI